MTSTPISVTASTSNQQVWAADGSRVSAIIENTAGPRAYLRFGGDDATTSLGGYSYSLVEGASAVITAPESYQELNIIWAGTDGSEGLTGTYTTADTGISGDNTDLGDLKALIASDLERALADTTHGARTWDDEIGVAIGDAIQLYKSKHWWFLEEPTSTDKTTTTTASDSYVSEPTGLIQLDSLRITVNGQKYEVLPVRFDQMESFHDGVSTDTGEPYVYCRYGSRLRLYPTPGDAYTLTFSGLWDQASLTDDDITNDWMTHGRLAIKSMAKLILLRDYIKSYDDVPAAQQAVITAERALDREHIRRTGTRRLAARC